MELSYLLDAAVDGELSAIGLLDVRSDVLDYAGFTLLAMRMQHMTRYAFHADLRFRKEN